MNYIEVDRILEVVSDAVMNIEGHFKGKSPCIMPSFKEKQEVIDRLKVSSYFDFENETLIVGNADFSDKPADIFPLYNYLVLDPIIEFQESSLNYAIHYIVRGFDSFGAVNDYVMGYSFNSMCTFYVYVDGYYRELQPRFTLQEKDKRTYVSPYFFQSQVRERDKYDFKLYELLGLCEFINKTDCEFMCYIATSLEDVADHLVMGRCADFVSDTEDKLEEGYVFFDNKFYPYKIINNIESQCCWSELYAADGSGLVYDSESHEFVKPEDNESANGIGWVAENTNDLEDILS